MDIKRTDKDTSTIFGFSKNKLLVVTFKSLCRKEKALESYYPPEG